jgi:hypothetical protein
MTETQGARSRLVKGVTVLVSLLGLAFGFISPSDATHD